ncbi:acyl-CoA thioesterase [Methylobacterium sp. E-066]|uniref:acyl-CoA thioesterase n=1 Tax=Methylobacterium sp. E-066 TaxID=2836584 RepID=UPI00244535E0|nr:hotdog domain-containing protein [Methylobacterium sp. E-066]
MEYRCDHHIFESWTVSQMDLAGSTFVAQRAPWRFVTVSIDAMRFLRPIEVGDEESVYCILQEEGDTSIAVKIETWVRDRSGTNPEKVTEGVFTYLFLSEKEKAYNIDVGR